MNRQGAGKIEWTDYTINLIKGRCRLANEHPWCYAVGMYDRHGWNPDIRLDMRDFDAVEKLSMPAKIFVGSTHEMFGDWVPSVWRRQIGWRMQGLPQHIFQILTELPENMHNDVNEFPPNVWVGVTVQSQDKCHRIDTLRTVKATVKFVSFEPLHGEIKTDLTGIDWIIIGAETGNRRERIKPNWRWVDSLIAQATVLKIPTFLKSNLEPYKPVMEMILHKEFPKVN